MSNRPVILITGSSGLIGGATVQRLADRYTVIGIDKPGRACPSSPAAHVEMDLADDHAVRSGLRQIKERFGPDLASVIHLAAYYDFSGAPSELYEQVTVRGTERLMQGFSALQLQVQQFIFTSTMTVHAPSLPGRKINERWPLGPKWDDPQSKMRAEQVVAVEHRRIPALILRLAGVYTDRCQSLPLAHQIQRIYEMQLEGHVFPGDLTHGQAFVHLDDLTAAFESAIDHRHALPGIDVMLMGEDTTLSYGRLQEEFGRLLWGKPWKTDEISKGVAKAGSWVENHLPWGQPFIHPWMIDICDDHYELDVSRARQSLGWTPQRSLLQTLPKMVASLKEDPRGWYMANHLGGAPPSP